MTKMYTITTIDNPYNPFEDFTQWFLFDVSKGYNTSGYLARVSNITDSMSEEESIVENNRAVDEIIKYDFMNRYKRIYKKDDIETEK